MRLPDLAVFVFLSTFSQILAIFKQFDDGVIFKLNWPGQKDDLEESLDIYRKDGHLSTNFVLISTSADEKYLCSLPHIKENSDDNILDYTGPTPAELLEPLSLQRSCTYRIEMFWTYELCHGRFLLQYHEEKDNNRRTTRQEYYLGQYMSDIATKDDNAFDIMNPPTRKFDDLSLPYYPVRYLQGTVCDINSKPRSTLVKYVCMPDGKNQIHSLTEIASCEYEVIVFTNRLCSHPAYRAKETPEHPIGCYSLDSPQKPTALTIWEKEQNWELEQQYRRAKQPPIRVVPNKRPIQTRQTTTERRDPPPSQPPPVDSALAKSFLTGDYCLYGGSGWWKYEYCHGKQVIQFHEDSKTGRIEVLLGSWNEQDHLEWIKGKSHKQPIKVDGQIRQATHFYNKGDNCDLTNVPRTVEVRLRCRETQGNANAVTLYLLEPKTCEYILGVESQMFCDLLQTADSNGLLKA